MHITGRVHRDGSVLVGFFIAGTGLTLFGAADAPLGAFGGLGGLDGPGAGGF